MIGGLVSLARGVWAWTGNVLDAIGDWLREDHNWWRIGCFTAAGLFIFAAFVALDRQKTIVLVQTQATAAAQKCVDDKALAAMKAGNAQAALDEITATLAEKAAQLATLQAQNAALSDKNAELKNKANHTYEQFMGRYRNRPKQCDAALKVLAEACPSLEGY